MRYSYCRIFEFLFADLDALAMLPDILSLDYCDRNNMDVPPTYWADVNDCQENIGDTTEPNLPPLDTNMQLAVWLPFHSTPASLSPGLFPRANTAPLQVRGDHIVDTR